MKTWKIPVTWRMTGFADVEGPDPETAVETFEKEVEMLSAEKQFELVKKIMEKEDTIVEEGTIEVDRLFQESSVIRYMYLFDENRVTGILTYDGYYASIGPLDTATNEVEIRLSLIPVMTSTLTESSSIDEETMEYLFSDADSVETFKLTPGNKEKMAMEIFDKLYEHDFYMDGMTYLVEATYYPELTFEEMFNLQ